MATHCCPAPGCDVQVPRHQLACRTHWFTIPKPLRDELNHAYREHGYLSEQHAAALESCCDFLEQDAA